MKTNPLGRTRVEVSTLGFGAAPIGNLFSAIDDRTAQSTVDGRRRMGGRDPLLRYRARLSRRHSAWTFSVNYRFVYAVEPPHAPADWMRVVGQVTGCIQFGHWQGQDPGGPLQPWDVTAYPAEAGTRCGMTDGYGHPDYPGGPLDKVQPAGALINPYSMDIPVTTGACRRTAGT